ncbi:hypothetical protein KPL70_001143 [Citrus sinensis]|nr:hypothetical protein KPL70_001143 [Citrus sinensis]
MQQIHQNLQSRIGQLDSELRAMLAHRYNGPEFDQKEREIRRLKAELAQIESEKQRPTLFTSSPLIPSIGPTYHPFASMLSPIKQYDPSKLFGMTHTLFRDNPLPPPPKPKPKPRPQPRPPPLHPSSLTIPGQPSPTFTPTSPPAPLSVPAPSKDKEPMNQFTAHAVIHSSTDDQTSDSNLAVSDSHTETDSESSASTSDSEKSYADITKILMAQPDQGQTSHTEPYVDIPSEVEEEMPESSATNQPSPAQPNPPSQKSSNGPWFTFDDLPSHKWRDRLNEMSAWIDLQMLRTGATTQSVLREFATRFTGALRDWFDSLGQYRQLQFVDLPEVSSALAVLHDQFLGDPSAVFEAARRDYLNMKCCSLNAKDLDFHYKRMSLLFYKLNGFNEPTLKHVFLASLPEELQPDIQRQLTASNLSLDNISLGKIFQLAKTCLDKLCEQKQFFKELLKDKEPFRSACKKPYLQIKCHKKKDCDCSSKKKRHFRKFKTPEFSSKPRRSRKPYRFFRKKSSSSREFKRKQSSRCFICKRKGHYAKDCPNKREKAIRLVEHLQATTDYSPAKDELEFYFSEQDEPNDETVFALQNSFDSDSDQSQVIFHQQLLSLDTTVPIPSIKLQILPSKFQRPIPAIGLIDTGAQRSMLNPHILPPEYWTQSEEHFKAVNGKLFTTSLITKKSIGIQIFPNCVIWTKVIGSTLPNKDILLGFDILHQIKHLQIIPTGIRVKSMFKPFTNILKLYNLSETPQSYQDISTKLLSFCPESHSEFTHPNPLWKNKSFFIKLPFKLNEDINPTKATHPGMSPSDLLLAQQECSQLLAQGLIEPTSSQWACQAFYVEKHSEIVRGKKRLVIDYQPLNMFLQDDKFPLPRRQSMFTFLKNAQIFSKFDLKSGFWQLGIEPSERYKTAFCIPNAHFQWTVLPFGLKTAPSIFQKSMVQIFQPILHHALIYIDDILLFSGSHEEHRNLLSQFYDIIQRHGIMLSAKKSTIATDNIEFLGMIIKDGHYQPGKHIAQELLHFPDQQLSKRQIQQFLGIINYIRDFLPHVDHHTHHLSALLKKKPPEWNADHTRAVTTLKQIAQNPPPLKLITDGKRILQTDASDESWGAILLEELNDKEHFIAYASGHFSETQKHYHSVFKEILAVKNGIKKFEYHLIGHHFLIRMDSSAFPNIFHFKGKTVPEKMLLRLKDWFSKYDFSVKHIKGSQNLIPDMLSRLSKPQDPLTLFSTTYHFSIISMATSLPPEALTKKTFPFNKTFSSVFDIQEFARKALFRFFMKAYLVTDPFPFSTFHPENLFLTGLTLDPTRDTTEDVLWYIWCLTVLYATKLVLPISPTLDHLLNPDNATSLTWTLLEWFSPIPWWRKKLQQLSEIYNLDRMPAPEAQMFTSVFIIHRPYFQHPDTHLFWTQDQVYEWFTAPHIAVIENDIQDVLHNYLCQLNHQPPPLKDISHTSLGPQHDLLMIPTPSAISKPKSTGIIIKEERPDYTDFLYQDSQDPWEDFLPLSQHLHQFPQPTMDEPGPSVPGPSTQSSKRPAQPSKVDKATQTSPKYTPKCTPRDYNCPYPPCRGPSCKHPKLSKTFFQKHPHSGDTDPDETESSSEDEFLITEFWYNNATYFTITGIQQFLGIINYIRDFLPHVDHHTHHLSALLKKKPPEWNADHTRAVTTLRQIAQNPPPLKLITDGKRILQTDASDESWGAILLEELNDKEHFIAYASGHFSETQKHYHSVFKEILAVKNGIKKFEYHLIGHHFLIRMNSSAFPNIFHFKGKTVPEKMLLRLKDWFSKYDFSVKHIKGSQNLIPDMLSRLSKPQDPLTLFSTTYHFSIISMATSLPPEALTKKTFPFNKTFSSVFDIQEFARKALFRFFMKAYLVTDPFPFSTFHPENLFLTGLTLDPTRDTTEDVLWYIWCLTVLYATKLVLPISPTLDHLLNPDNATSLTWTLLEWFSPIPWWRKKLQQLSEIYNLDRMPAPEAQMFTSVFIIHRPYFQHPDTHLFWTQDQVYEWFTAPHIAVIENDIQDVLHNYLCQLNHQPPPLKDISHTSLGPQHDLLMIPTPSAISKPKSTGIIIKEERPDYTDFLYQDSQDPWEDFLPLSQHLHQFPQPTMDEPGPSVPGPSTQSSKRPAQPSKVDKATQTSPKYTPKCTPRDYNCPYPPCRGPSCKHPKLSKTFFQKHPHSGDTDPDETESSSEDEYMNLRSP